VKNFLYVVKGLSLFDECVLGFCQPCCRQEWHLRDQSRHHGFFHAPSRAKDFQRSTDTDRPIKIKPVLPPKDDFVSFRDLLLKYCMYTNI
jgi:hypothetical protein